MQWSGAKVQTVVLRSSAAMSLAFSTRSLREVVIRPTGWGCIHYESLFITLLRAAALGTVTRIVLDFATISNPTITGPFAMSLSLLKKRFRMRNLEELAIVLDCTHYGDAKSCFSHINYFVRWLDAPGLKHLALCVRGSSFPHSLMEEVDQSHAKLQTIRVTRVGISSASRYDHCESIARILKAANQVTLGEIRDENTYMIARDYGTLELNIRFQESGRTPFPEDKSLRRG
jgi:hypothetical protein